MKKTLLLSMLGAIALTGYSQESVSIFSYANENSETASWGLSSKQRYDVAMCLNSPALKGTKISEIQAYISSPEGMGECSVWMSHNLELNSKDLVTDIMSQTVVPQSGKYSGKDLGVLVYKFDNPYEYNGEEIWIGYSVEVEDLGTTAQKNPIFLADGINPNGFWLHGTRNPLKWMNYSDRVEGVAVINVMLQGDFPENALSLNSVDYTLTSLNNPFEIIANVSNIGSTDIKSFSYSYTIAGQSFEGTVNLDNPITPNLATPSQITIPTDPIKTIGLFNYDLSIPQVNGVTNQSANAQASAEIGVLSEPIVNRPLVEEYTGLWCGWCPRGFQGMEELGAYYGDEVVIVCWHNGDPMTVTNSYPVAVSGFPSASINRNSEIDPYFGTTNKYFGIKDDVQAYKDQPAICDIKIKSVEISGNMLNVVTTSQFAKNIENANYSVGFILTANGLSNASWAQENYIGLPSYASQYKDTPLGEWATMGSSVYGLVFNDVGVSTQGMNGVSGSLPTTIKFGENYDTEYSVQCQDIKSIYGNRPVIDVNLDNAYINFFIIDNNTKKVLNANKFNLLYESGVEQIGSDSNEVIETVYYDLTGRKVLNPSNGIFIKAQKMNNGSIKTSKEVIR